MTLKMTAFIKADFCEPKCAS